MIKVLQHGQRLLDDFMGFFAFNVNNETNSAGIMFEVRVVKSLFWRQSGKAHILTLSFP
jgi:hypothetical protein